MDQMEKILPVVIKNSEDLLRILVTLKLRLMAMCGLLVMICHR